MEVKIKQKREINVQSIFANQKLNETDKVFLLLINHVAQSKESIGIEELQETLNQDVYKVIVELLFKGLIEIRNGKLLLMEEFLVKQLSQEEKMQLIARSIGELNKKNEPITFGMVSELTGIRSQELRENKEFSEVIESFLKQGKTYNVDQTGSVSFPKPDTKNEENKTESKTEGIKEGKKERTKMIVADLRKKNMTQVEIARKHNVSEGYVSYLKKNIMNK